MKNLIKEYVLEVTFVFVLLLLISYFIKSLELDVTSVFLISFGFISGKTIAKIIHKRSIRQDEDIEK